MKYSLPSNDIMTLHFTVIAETRMHTTPMNLMYNFTSHFLFISAFERVWAYS